MKASINNLNNRCKKYIFLCCFTAIGFFLPLKKLFASGYGLTSMAQGMGFRRSGDTSDPNLIAEIGAVVAIILSISGVLFLGIMIWGANMWMTAKGNEQQVEQARKLIVQAIMGIIIAFSSFGLTYFLVTVLTGAALNVNP